MLKAAGAAFGLAALGGCGVSDTQDDWWNDGDDGKGDGFTDSKLLAGIDTVVVLCMENRSFDHYLGSRLIDEGLNVNGITGDESNPAPDGSSVSPFRLDEFVTQDIDHSWDACHAQWNHGKNDGFVMAHAGPNQRDPMGYHDRAQLPAAYQLGDAFSVCDRWHASVMGPTWPNRFYLHGATSKGGKTNTPIAGFKSIWSLLDDADISHKNYFHDVPWATSAYGKLSHLSRVENFFEDAQAGKLPSYSLIDPQFFGAGANDDHPDHNPQLGQALIASIYAALAQSPQWNRCLFVVTYDEHGGFYDHVAPPKISSETNAEFQQLGFRVPSIVAGPMVKQGATVSAMFDHVSILSTVSRRFKLPALNDRVREHARPVAVSRRIAPARDRAAAAGSGGGVDLHDPRSGHQDRAPRGDGRGGRPRHHPEGARSPLRVDGHHEPRASLRRTARCGAPGGPDRTP